MNNIKEIEVKNIISKSNLLAYDYAVNPYIGCLHGCKYCYASFMKKFTGHSEEWGEFVDVKFWNPIKIFKKYNKKSIFIGSVTDPYQPIELRYERTKAFLEEIKDFDINVNISTKSDLILRDLNLIKQFKNINVSWSINTLDEDFRKEMDNAVSIERRISCMKTFYDEKIKTTCFISPIFPGITDVIAIIKKCRYCCNTIWLEKLNLRDDFKLKILNYITNYYPHLYNLYKEIYIDNKVDYWKKLDKEIKDFCDREKLLYVKDNNVFDRDFCNNPIVVNYFYHDDIKDTK